MLGGAQPNVLLVGGKGNSMVREALLLTVVLNSGPSIKTEVQNMCHPWAKNMLQKGLETGENLA